jgi:hypothetical protein
MDSNYAPTWAELDTTATWLDVDYSDVPKFAAKWHSNLSGLHGDLESIPTDTQGRDNE